MLIFAPIGVYSTLRKRVLFCKQCILRLCTDFGANSCFCPYFKAFLKKKAVCLCKIAEIEQY